MFISYLISPQINPIIFSLGPISLHWYGLMYFISFIFSKMMLLNYINFFGGIYWDKKREEVEYLLYISFFSLLIGGRIGYAIFYHPIVFCEDVFRIFKIWEGGMSFHGGLIGVLIAWIIVAYYKNYRFFQISDFIIPVIPFGLAAGRLGNFINGELYGRVNINVPWAMFFVNAREQDMLYLLNHPQFQFLFDNYGALPRHPSQLYEMMLEGVLLFIIINLFIRKSHPIGSVSGLFLLCYGVFRIISECFREPDMHLGLFMKGWISMGQLLSVPMIISGMVIIFLSYSCSFKTKDNNE